MSMLYAGNLPDSVTEADIVQVFRKNRLNCGTIVIKKGGYAFIECADQSTADQAIDKLNGKNLFGTPILLEPSVAGAPVPQRKNPQFKTPNKNQLVTG